MIAREMEILVQILDEKGKVAMQRIEAVLSGNRRKTAYIEEYIYPAIRQRMLVQIERVNQEFMKHESEHNEKKEYC